MTLTNPRPCYATGTVHLPPPDAPWWDSHYLPVTDGGRPDAQLAYEILDLIAANTAALNMGEWFTAQPEPGATVRIGLDTLLDDDVACGTSACLAGWACAVAGYTATIRKPTWPAGFGVLLFDQEPGELQLTTPTGTPVTREFVYDLLHTSPHRRSIVALVDSPVARLGAALLNIDGLTAWRLFWQTSNGDLAEAVEAVFGPRPKPREGTP